MDAMYALLQQLQGLGGQGQGSQQQAANTQQQSALSSVLQQLTSGFSTLGTSLANMQPGSVTYNMPSTIDYTAPATQTSYSFPLAQQQQAPAQQVQYPQQQQQAVAQGGGQAAASQPVAQATTPYTDAQGRPQVFQNGQWQSTGNAYAPIQKQQQPSQQTAGYVPASFAQQMGFGRG